MAKVAPAPGTVVKQTIETQSFAAPLEVEKDQRDFWEFTAALSPEQWRGFMIYVYRRVDGADQLGKYIAKYGQYVDEDFIARTHGGGKFRLFLKTTAGELRKRAELEIEGAPIIASVAPGTATPSAPNPNSGENGPMNRLCDLLEKVLIQNSTNSGQGVVNDAMRNALTLQSDGFKSLIPMVTSVRDTLNPPPAASGMDPLLQQFLQAAMAKMLNPSDPIQTFAAMLNAMKGIGLDIGGGHSQSIGAELVRAGVQALPQIVEGVKAYTGAVKAQADVQILQLQRGALPAPAAAQPQTIHVVPQSAPDPQTAAPATPAAAPAPAQPARETNLQVTIDDVERHIGMLVVNEKLSVKDAAEETLDYLQLVSPEQLYPYVCSLDEANLTAFINARPLLSHISQHPRFAEFVKNIVLLTHQPEPASDSPNTSAPSPA